MGSCKDPEQAAAIMTLRCVNSKERLAVLTRQFSVWEAYDQACQGGYPCFCPQRPDARQK